jgi:hypothetical protein
VSFRTDPYTVSDEDIQDTVMSALEDQLKKTSLRLNPKMDLLYKRTVYALGTVYKQVSLRGTTSETHMSGRFFVTETTN